MPIRRLGRWLYLLAYPVIKFRKPFIIGITGSVGKTTTTELLAHILKHPEVERRLGPVGQTFNNMNDDVGLPATLLLFDDLKEEYSPSRMATVLRAPWQALLILLGRKPYPRLFVLEYGAGWGGHIAQLVKLAPPNIAVVTTIGPSHLERFQTIEGVAQEKIQLVKAVARDGVVILGTGHPFVDQFSHATTSPVICVEGVGRSLAENIVKAICRQLQLPDDLVASRLSSFPTPKGRLNILHFATFTLIDDSYNANPLSMKLALDELDKLAAASKRKVAILGFMAELGSDAASYHREIGKYARRRADLLIGVGDLAQQYEPDLWFANSDECAQHIDDIVQENDCLLVKGSGSAAMRKIVIQLCQMLSESNDHKKVSQTTKEES